MESSDRHEDLWSRKGPVLSDDNTQITYGNELARKAIHIASLGIPIIYLQVPHTFGIGLLVAMTITSLAIDVLMHYHEPTRALMMKLVGALLRQHEKQTEHFRLTGASWVLIAATVTMFVFPTSIAVTAFTILIVSDTFAALVGRRYGNRRFLDKSFVGAVTFIATGVGVVLFYWVVYDLPLTFVLCGTIGSLVGGIMEAGSISLKVDDNISVPTSIGIVMWLLDILFTSLGYPSFSGVIP